VIGIGEVDRFCSQRIEQERSDAGVAAFGVAQEMNLGPAGPIALPSLVTCGTCAMLTGLGRLGEGRGSLKRETYGASC